MPKALVIVDVQNDFCEGGALGVDGGVEVAKAISEMDFSQYDYVVGTKDWHINPGSHWSDTPDYVDSWPVHCKATTLGAEYFWLLEGRIPATFYKGTHSAAYSGFEGVHNGQTLDEFLKYRGVDEVDIVGIATDYCVNETALDAARLGYKTNVLLDLTAAVHPDQLSGVRHAWDQAGVSVVRS